MGFRVAGRLAAAGMFLLDILHTVSLCLDLCFSNLTFYNSSSNLKISFDFFSSSWCMVSILLFKAIVSLTIFSPFSLN